ncbi:hypothetical protein JOM56_004121 [Amanita muscaria]
MDMLVPFQMLYADGIERLGVESLLERQRWVNRIWEAVNRPISVPNSSDVTRSPRSPTGSIRTILSIDSRSSSTSTGSRSTVYVPPMNTLTDIPDFQSDFSSNSRSTSANLGLARRVSLVSSHHKHTVDDTVIQNQEYVYPGDPRHIPPSRGNSLRRTGSMSDLDHEFARALKAKKSGLVGSPVTISSGPSLGQDVFITPPPSLVKGSDRSRSELSLSQSDEAFVSARLSGSSSGMRSNVSSTYYSQTGDQTTTALLTDETIRGLSSSGTFTQTPSLSYQSNGSLSYSQTESPYSSASPSGLSSLSRAREVRRRLNRVSSRSMMTTLTDEPSDKENSISGSGSYTYSGTPATQSYGLSGSYTAGSGDLTTLSGSYTPGSAEYSPASGSYSPASGSYTQSQSSAPGSRSYISSQSYSSNSGSYSLQSGSYTPSGNETSNGNGPSSSNGVSAIRNGSSSESRLGEESLTPGTETGYDICPSSDMSGLTPATISVDYSTSPALSSPVPIVIRRTRQTRQTRQTPAPPRIISPRKSVDSFDTCPTIPSESDYATADEASTYSTARTRPSKAASTEYLTVSEPVPPSEYVTAALIPSEESTPHMPLSSLGSEESLPGIASSPSPIPSVRSLTSSAGESALQPHNISLPASIVPSERSLPPTPLLPALLPPVTMSTPSLSVTEDSRSSVSPHESPLLPSPAGLASDEDEGLLPLLSTRTHSARSEGSLANLSEPGPFAVPIYMPPPSVSSPTEESSGPPLEEQPHTSASPSSLIAPSSVLWAGDDETERSFLDSSHLQPSPSMMSIEILEGPDRSYETSFLRPSGSVVSSVNKLSTLPVSPSMLTTRTSLPRLASPVLRPSESSPSPALRLSESSSSPALRLSESSSSPALRLSESSSSITPSAETMSSSSSSFSDGLSSPSQPSLSPSSIVSLPLPSELGIDEESVVGRAPRTISTLLDTARASVRSASRSPTPTPIRPRTHTVTPEGTVVMSVSTPYGSGGTDQASLSTESEEPLPPTPRDIALELDRLAEDLRGYNNARGQEGKEISDNVKALRDELQDLSEYLRSTPPPNVVRIIERPVAPGPRPMESRSVGGSTEITALRYLSPEGVPESIGAALTRASSITSVGSFLSSHHSDDLSLYAASLMPPISDIETEFEDESSFVSSSEVTESEVMPATPVQIMPPTPIPPPEIMPTPSTRSSFQPTRSPPGVPLVSIDWMAPLNAIREQLDSLTDEQAATLRKMDSLRAPEYPEIPAMHDKINRVEDLVRGLIQKFESQPPQPVMVPVPMHLPTTVPPEPRPPSRAATVHDLPAEPDRTSLTDSEESSLIRRIESDLLAPRATQTAPSFAEQLQEILSSTAHGVPSVVDRPPPLNRFRYEPLEGGTRPRSASPASLESILQRGLSAPTVADEFPEILRNLLEQAGRPHDSAPSSRTEDASEGAPPNGATGTAADDEAAYRRRLQQMMDRRTKVPQPGPVFPEPTSAPGTVGGGDPVPESWYRTTQDQPPVTERPADGVAPQPESTRREPAYVPLPPGPQLMSFVRVSYPQWNQFHLAQTATYQQQQDLSRYMRELNEWLARDVNDRHDELNAVTARLDILTNALLSRQESPHFTTTMPMPVPHPRFPSPTPVVPPVVPPVIPSVGHPVIPPVIPHHHHHHGTPRTPDPDFTPVIPAPPQPPPPILSTTFVPPVHPGPPFPQPVTGRSPRRDSPPPGPFIPPLPDAAHPLDDGLVHGSESPDSSSFDSTESGERDEPSSSTPLPRPPRQLTPTHISYARTHDTESSVDSGTDTSSPAVPVHVVPPSITTLSGPQQIQPLPGPPIQIIVPPAPPARSPPPTPTPTLPLPPPQLLQPLLQQQPQLLQPLLSQQPPPQLGPQFGPTIIQQTQPSDGSWSDSSSSRRSDRTNGRRNGSRRSGSRRSDRSDGRRGSSRRSTSRPMSRRSSPATVMTMPIAPTIPVSMLGPALQVPQPVPQFPPEQGQTIITVPSSAGTIPVTSVAPPPPQFVAVPGPPILIDDGGRSQTGRESRTRSPSMDYPRRLRRGRRRTPSEESDYYYTSDYSRTPSSHPRGTTYSPPITRSPTHHSTITRSPTHRSTRSRTQRGSSSPITRSPTHHSRITRSPTHRSTRSRTRRGSSSPPRSPTESHRHTDYDSERGTHRASSSRHGRLEGPSPYDREGRRPRLTRHDYPEEHSPLDDDRATDRASSTQPRDQRPYDDRVRDRPRTVDDPREQGPSTERPVQLPSPEQGGAREQAESSQPLDGQAPRQESPSPLPRPVAPVSQRQGAGSRSPTPTRSPTPRYVRAPSERERRIEPITPITVIVPRRDRSPTIVSLAPEEEESDYTGEAPRHPASQRSVSGGRSYFNGDQPFSTQPSLYTPPNAPAVPRDEEDSYRGEPTVREPTPRPSTRTASDFVPSRRTSGRTSTRAMSDALDSPEFIPPHRRSRTSTRTMSDALDSPEFIPPHRRPRTTSESLESIPTDRVSPLDLRQEQEQEQQLQRMDDVESRLDDVETSVREAEDRRELAFRQNEDDRHRIFLENQERRDQEARDRGERLLEAIDSRLASLVPLMPAQPPPPSPPSEAVSEEPEAVMGDAQSMIDSVRTASQEAAIQYSRDIQDIIKAEREEFAREREAAAAERDRLLEQAEAERSRLAEERETRIRELEEQVASMKQELEDEKQRRLTEEADAQERQREELQERDEMVRTQLGDITNLIHDQRQVCEAKKDLMQAQWEEKQRRRLDKDARYIELRDMVLKLHEDMENDRAKTEDYRRSEESKPGYDQLVEELNRQNAEQRELLTNLSESWRADCAKHQEETLNAVRQTAQEQVPFNVQGYLDEFSKALATEVRMLLGEVGKLREERRALQHEIGFLLTMNSKYGPGGEFEPEWKPGMPPGGPPGPGDGPPPDQPPAPEQPPQQFRPGWRPVPGGKKKKKKEAPPAPVAPAGPATMAVDPRRQIQSWATWQRKYTNCLIVISPLHDL